MPAHGNEFYARNVPHTLNGCWSFTESPVLQHNDKITRASSYPLNSVNKRLLKPLTQFPCGNETEGVKQALITRLHVLLVKILSRQPISYLLRLNVYVLEATVAATILWTWEPYLQLATAHKRNVPPRVLCYFRQWCFLHFQHSGRNQERNGRARRTNSFHWQVWGATALNRL